MHIQYRSNKFLSTVMVPYSERTRSEPKAHQDRTASEPSLRCTTRGAVRFWYCAVWAYAYYHTLCACARTSRKEMVQRTRSREFYIFITRGCSPRPSRESYRKKISLQASSGSGMSYNATRSSGQLFDVRVLAPLALSLLEWKLQLKLRWKTMMRLHQRNCRLC